MKIHTMPQRSEAWNQIRAGKITSSCAAAIIKVRQRGEKDKPLKERSDLIERLAGERLTGQPDDKSIRSDDMQRGIDMEGAAFAAYEWETGLLVDRVGFVEHDTLAAGCSPDGIIYGPGGTIAGGIELKVPKTVTHLAYLKAGRIPEEYRPQLLHDLWMTGAPWWDFVSYDDRVPKPLQLFRVRLEAKDVDLVAYQLCVSVCLTEVDKAVAALLALGKSEAVA